MQTSTCLPVTLADIEAAALVLDGKIVRTAFTHSRTLSEITRAEIWVKLENQQYTAAFKERGALNKLSRLTLQQGQNGVITASAGNHAQGVAYHARRLGIPATIVMAETTPYNKVKHTRDLGARVLLEGQNFDEAKDAALRICRNERLIFVHPFDDKDIIAGQGTLALEMLADQPDLDTLIVPIGGGGLISGIAVAAKALKPSIRIIGVEAAMYASMQATLRGETPKTGGATIAEGIAVHEPGQITRRIVDSLVDDIVLVEEDHLERAITLFLEVEKTISEGAGAAGLAALLAHPDRFIGRKIGLILCGGNIDTRLLASVLSRSLVRENRLASIRIVGDDQPGLLALVAKTIGDAGANVIEVAHNRISLDVPAKGAEFDILIETRDSNHTHDVIAALSRIGYPPSTL